MKTIYIFIAFVLGSSSVIAQQTPHYSQYMYNMGIVNPAYMINEPGVVQIGNLFRKQWVGIEGAPRTVNIFSNIPLTDKMEIGVNFVNDRIGSQATVTQNIFDINFAYKVKLTEKTNLSFGLKTGLDNIALDFTKMENYGDPMFQNMSHTMLNIGTGVFLFKKRYYAGFSIPNLIPNDLNSSTSHLYQSKSHLYFISGYVFEISDKLKLKPSVIVKEVSGAPLSMEALVNMLINNKVELGVSSRYEDSITGIVNFYITPDLRIGYAYEYTLSRLQQFNSGSHELILIYRLNTVKLSNSYTSPRFY
ncbi:PorP/SprF family type IX secretion system membrane protein [Flavobacterium sp. UBA7680]|uniref:PorP/SprF family type IX secretion system membrane protein n=1 Tax=Flavobacterium sp. UBA7680 TaxID=1946559 RepID=UPI0025B9FE1B|nr:type IX secretion system membrane protein PorP/SprF [Flavobacterium sp. UBA7680]